MLNSSFFNCLRYSRHLGHRDKIPTCRCFTRNLYFTWQLMKKTLTPNTDCLPTNLQLIRHLVK